MTQDWKAKALVALRRRTKQELGLPLGPLMIALLELVFDDSGGSLATFERYGFSLIIPPHEPGITPKNVATFAQDVGGHGRFAFVKPEKKGATTDELPVCYIEPGAVDVLAPNLAAFLSLFALLGPLLPDRATDDATSWKRREALIAAEIAEEGESEFLAASNLLCTLPGVALPAKPSLLQADLPAPTFVFDEQPPLSVTLHAVHDLLEEGNRPEATRVLVYLVAKFLELGAAVPAANWQALDALIDDLRPALSKTQRAAVIAARAETAVVVRTSRVTFGITLASGAAIASATNSDRVSDERRSPGAHFAIR